MKHYIFLLAFLITTASFAQGSLITAPETSEPDSLLIFTPQKRAAHIPYSDFEAKLKASFDNVYFPIWDFDYNDLINKPVYSNFAFTAPYLRELVPDTYLPSTTGNFILRGSFFTPDMEITIEGHTINYQTFVSSNEFVVNLTTSATDGLYDVTLDNGIEAVYPDQLKVINGTVYEPTILDMEIISGTPDLSVPGAIKMETSTTTATVELAYVIPEGQDFQIRWKGTKSPLRDNTYGDNLNNIKLIQNGVERYRASYWYEPKTVRFNQVSNGFGHLDAVGSHTASGTDTSLDKEYYFQRIGDVVTFHVNGTQLGTFTDLSDNGDIIVRITIGRFDITGIKYIDLSDDSGELPPMTIEKAEHISVNTLPFTGNLSGADNTVQKALETIDALNLGGGGGSSDDQTASEVPFTPYSTIAATNVQDAIEEVLDEIPTSLAAANITVSPSIGGNTDAFAVMDDHEDRITALEESVTGLTPVAVTYNANLSFAYSASTPNRYVNLTGGISSISITGLNEGDGGILELIRGSGSANSSINFEGMVKPYFFPKGEGASILLSYIQTQNGLQIYCNNCLDIETINVPIVGFDLSTALTTGVNKGMYVIPYDVSVYDVIATNFTAGSSTGTTIDINADGESIFSTLLTIDATENSSLNATIPYVLETSFLPKGTILTVDNDIVPIAANGQSVQLLVYKDFEGTITPPEEEIVLRINAGGASDVVATDGFIDWEANSTGTGANHTSTGGAIATTTSTTWTIHSSASATGVPSADLQLLFDSMRETNAAQSYQATLPNGNYEVILFMGEILGTNNVVVDITIEGVLVDDDFAILGTFGEDSIGARVYNVTVADGQLNISVAKVSGSNSAKVAAIQVKKI